MTFNGRHRSKNSSESSEAKVSPSIPDNTTKKKREGNSRGTEATGERDECYEPEDVEIPRQKLKTEDLDRDKGSVTVVARNTSSNTDAENDHQSDSSAERAHAPTSSHDPQLELLKFPFSTARSLPGLTSGLVSRLQKAREFCRAQSLKLLPSSSRVGDPNTSLLPHEIMGELDSKAYAVMSRIYVGSINFELNEQHIRVVFSQFGYVKDISMTIDPDTGRHRGYCFVEFEVPEAAHLALQCMNGTELAGRQLKVGRPNNYNPAVALAALPQVSSRIYISNVNEHITEENVYSIFEAFGALRACVLLPDPVTLKHKTNGYVEFVDESAIQETVDSMNGFELGGFTLHVMKAIYGGTLPIGVSKLKSLLQSLGISSVKPPDLPPLQPQQALQVAPLQKAAALGCNSKLRTEQDDESIFLDENVYISASQRYSIMQKLSRQNFTDSQIQIKQDTQLQKRPSCVCLQNIALVKDIDEDFSSEILIECKKFGKVLKIVISAQGKSISPPNPNDLVAVYIQFDSPDSATRSQVALNKRFFAGRVVQADLCDSLLLNAQAAHAIKIDDCNSGTEDT